MACLIAALVVTVGFVGGIFLADLARYRKFHGAYPWQDHPPLPPQIVAVLDANGNTRYITDNEDEEESPFLAENR